MVYILGQCFHRSLCQSAILQKFLQKLNSDKVRRKRASCVDFMQTFQSILKFPFSFLPALCSLPSHPTDYNLIKYLRLFQCWLQLQLNKLVWFCLPGFVQLSICKALFGNLILMQTSRLTSWLISGG